MHILHTVCALLVLVAFHESSFSQEKPGDTKTTQIGGKTIEQWIKEIGAADPSKRENAIRTVLLFGPDRAYVAVPTIVKELDKPPPIDASIRVNGALALGVILGGVRDPDPKIVKDGVRVLKRLVSDPQQIVRFKAVQALGRIGPEARDTIPDLIAATREPSTWETRQAAAFALGFVALEEKKGPGQNVIDALYKSLGDKAFQVRLAAIQSITWLGAPGDASYKAGMVKSLEPVAAKDADPTVQLWAHMAIMSINHEVDKVHLAALAKFLKHKDVPARAQAAQALGTIGARAKAAIPALIEALDDDESAVVGWVIYALGRMENWGKPALPALDKIVRDPRQPEGIRRAAQEATESIIGKKIEAK